MAPDMLRQKVQKKQEKIKEQQVVSSKLRDGKRDKCNKTTNTNLQWAKS